MSTMSVSRRDMLKVSALGAGALVLPFERVVRARDAGEMDPKNFPRPYSLAYVKPDVIDMRGGGEVHIKQVMFDATILPKYKTKVFGYEYTHNGQVKRSSPGPTIVCEKGRDIRVRMENALPAKHPKWGYETWTSCHLHGSASKPQYDGYASDITRPGEEKTYEFPNFQNARTLWYHDHGVHHTAENAYMGLAGMYILTDSDERALNLPSGEYDLPIVVTDKQFDTDGSLMFDDEGHSGLYGDVVLVNGVPWPNLKVNRCKYRLRILNASLSRGLRLKLSSGKMTVIGTDGGLMPAPQETDVLRVGMGERYEVVVDFTAAAAGTKIQLTNLGVPNSRDYDHTNKIMQFEVTANEGNRTFKVPTVLDDKNPVMKLQESADLAVVKLRLHRSNSTWMVNDDTWDTIVKSNYQKVVANPKPNEVQIWEIENSSGGWFHPTHLHLVDFKMLTRNGQPVFNYEQGPKDVAYVGENETVRLLVQFSHQEGRYMIHCHNLPHEDHDMMTQFRVGKDYGPEDPAKFNDPMGVKAVKVGQAPPTPTSSSVAPTTTSAAPTSTSSATVLPVGNPAPTTSARPTTTTRQTSSRQTTTRATTTTPTRRR